MRHRITSFQLVDDEAILNQAAPIWQPKSVAADVERWWAASIKGTSCWWNEKMEPQNTPIGAGPDRLDALSKLNAGRAPRSGISKAASPALRVRRALPFHLHGTVHLA
jgi:hypothetical protein